MKKTVKYILLAVILLSAAAGGIYYATAPVAVPLTVIQAKTAELSFSEQGKVTADSVVQIYPIAQGKLISVGVEEGQSVKAGDTICLIDSTPLKLKISQIQSDIQGYEAQIANLDVQESKSRSELLASKNSLLGELKSLQSQAKGNLVSVDEQLRLQNILINQNQKDLDRAQEVLSNVEALYNAGSVSKSDYEDARQTVAKSVSALEASKQQQNIIADGAGQNNTNYYNGAIQSINAQIEGINQSLSKNYSASMKDYYRALIESGEVSKAQLESDITDCAIKAGVDGIITRLDAKNTNFAAVGVPVAEISVPGKNIIEVYVSTKDIDSIKTGDTVSLTLKRREGDTDFNGEVTHIDTTAVTKLSALGVEEPRVRVEVRPSAPEERGVSLGIGYNVDVRFTIYSEENKFTVPKTALFVDEGKDMLWVVRDGRAQAAEVTKGLELRTETVIEAGLAQGDYVVTDANNEDLKNGVKVKN